MESSSLHVLIVDDSPEDRLIVRRLLARSNPGTYTVTEVDRGALVLAAYHATRPDCVLLDHYLPDMDGLEVLAALRAQSDVPVIVLTGATHATYARERPLYDTLDSLPKGMLTAECLSLTIQRAVTDVRTTRARAYDLALLSTMLDTLPIGVGVLDHELRFIQGNATLATLLDLPAATLRGQRFTDVWPDMALTLAPHCTYMLATSQPTSPHTMLVPGPHAEDVQTVWPLSLYMCAPSPHAGDVPRLWHVNVQLLTLPDMGTPGLCLVIHVAGAA
jgi:CheY-like chemotaxis protein